MIDKINDPLFSQRIGSIGQPGPRPAAVPAASRGTDFAQILEKEKLKFSVHAQERISQRNINLTDADISKISGALDRAAAKGAKESLLLMNDHAFIVSVKNRTVITAVDKTQENVFTNIDSAIIV